MKKVFLFAVLAAGLVACKKEAPKTEEGSTENAAPQIEEVSTEGAEQTAEVLKLEISGNDQMQFDKKQLKAKAGQTVELTLHHTGTMKAEAMGHDWVLLKPGTDIADFATKAIEAKANGYIPEGTDAVIAHTQVIGGGEFVTITFTAPEKGTYDYICSFPGHWGAMQGKFIVE